MSFPYKNPITSLQVGTTQSVPKSNTYGLGYSVNNIGGYMEVYSLNDLIYTIPTGTTGSIEYSGNTIPVEFTKGNGNPWSRDVLTLGSDNISSGRRRLGMLVYVIENELIYQFDIDGYETLWNNATGATNTVNISEFGTIVNNSTSQGQAFINAWTGSTIEGVSGNTRATSVWKKFYYLSLSGGTVSGPTIFQSGLTANTISATTFIGDSITLSNSASTISLNNTTRQQIKFFSGGTGAPTYNSYSAGSKIIFSDNISSISSGYAIGVDAGSLWYGADLAGNGHDWYAGTRKLASLVGSSGFQLIGLGGPATSAAMTISGTSVLGSKGGTGYTDFLQVINNWSGATNPNKWFRLNSIGGFEILNSAYSAQIFSLTDTGILSVAGGNLATTSSSDGVTNYLMLGNNNTQIYDDGNTHIHSRAANQSMWINTNGGQLNLLTQSPLLGGSIGSGIAIATSTLNGYVTINTGRTVTTAASYGYLINSSSPTGQYNAGSQTLVISLYANNRIWGQEIDAFSDERMKDIHGEITLEEGIKLVKNLKPIKYNWKEGDDKGTKAGYSAQQVIKSGFDHLIGLIPTEGLEETIDDDGFLSPKDTQFAMNYDQVTPYHGVVIKHLLEEIENLKNEIKELKSKIK